MLEWIVEHGKEILDVVAYCVAAASIIVEWTPSEKDDKVLAKIKKFLAKVATLNWKK